MAALHETAIADHHAAIVTRRDPGSCYASPVLLQAFRQLLFTPLNCGLYPWIPSFSQL